MYPVTTTFLNVVRAGGFTRTTTASVYFGGNHVVDLPITAGAVDIDRTADVRRTCQLTVGDPSFVPTFVNSPLAPYGAEVVVSSGIAYDNGQVETCQLGVFRIEEVDWDEAGGSLPIIKGYDRSKALADARFLIPIDRSGISAQFLLTRLVTDVMNTTVNIDMSLPDVTLPGGSVFDSERWQTMQTVSQAIGGEPYFDVHGGCVIAPVPGLTQSQVNSGVEVWKVDAGPTGVLVNASRGVTRTGVYNAVAVTGSAGTTGAAPMGFAADTDPRSPTYYGPANSLPYAPYQFYTNFGQVVLRKSNNLLTTSAQCTTAAQAELRNCLGLARSLTFECGWNPALQEGDIIKVVYLDGSSELHIIDVLHIPLAGGDDRMTASTRTLTYQTTANT